MVYGRYNELVHGLFSWFINQRSHHWFPPSCMNITTFIEANFPKTANPTPGAAGTHGTHGTQAGEVNFMELFLGTA